MDDISQQLDELIAVGEAFVIKKMVEKFNFDYGEAFSLPYYIVDNTQNYNQWQAEVIRFIKLYFNDEFDAINVLFDKGLNYRDSIISKLKSIKKYPAPFLSEIENKNQSENQQLSNSKIFIVHGHDEAMKLSVESFIKDIKLEPVILNKQANKSRTIFEKLEGHSDVKFAVVLLSPCDHGCLITSEDLKPRARQNVILELGYFIGLLGRSNVCILQKSELEIPSDINGIVYDDFDTNEGWKMKLATELKAAGLSFDLNDAIK